MSPTTDYESYLRSRAWRTKAKAAIRRVGNRCELCKRPDSQVHLEARHRAHTRIGHERDEDIEVLCKACHALRAPIGHAPKQPVPPGLDLIPTANAALTTPHTSAPGTVPPPLQLISTGSARSTAAAPLQLLPVSGPVAVAPQFDRFMAVQIFSPRGESGRVPRRRHRSLAFAWMLLIFAGGMIVWTLATVLTSPAPAATTRMAVLPVVEDLLPTPRPAATPPPQDPLAALTAYQQTRYAGPTYLATCPYTRTDTNLRTTPSTLQSEVIAVLPGGTCVPLSARSADGAWFAFVLDLQDDTEMLTWVSAGLIVDAPGDLPVVEAQPGKLPAAAPKPLPVRVAP